MSFKDKHINDRIREFNQIKNKYPTRLPIVVEKSKYSKIHGIDKNKYLVDKNMKFSIFVNIIRKRLKLKEYEAIFVTINGQLIPSLKSFGEIYEDMKHEDGFLYLTYSKENTFG